ncbi:general odorant-binding protein 71 [Amyelois transitella]|uniref:general odorant-binding protein 71 n=1 Tax=Amyelois transitella TaxID=680683 RepID=UPI00298F5017|nr:general odorant-binding protein 71 [Amyelois transitella]
MNCLNKQDGRNSSDSRRYSSDQDWNDARGYGQREWDRDSRSSNDKNRGDRMGSRSDRFGSGNDRMGSRDDRMNSRDGRIGNRDDRIGSNDRSSNRNERFGSRDNDMYGRDDRMDNNGMGARNRMGYQDEEIDRYRLNGRDDFSNDDYGSDMPRDSFYSSTQTPRRFRRDKRKEINSGHRSQYNPNAQKPTEYDDNYRNDDRNTSKNSSRDEDAKACALHCFLENLEMIGDSGMPDKYLVTHVLTKDVKNEDLRDFLQESIEECFQILENENTEDKCDFAKNLMMCLSEKGRSNCDDWKDDLKF